MRRRRDAHPPRRRRSNASPGAATPLFSVGPTEHPKEEGRFLRKGWGGARSSFYMCPGLAPPPSGARPCVVCLSCLRACFHMCEHARGASLDPRARLMLSHVPRPSSFMLRSLAICLVQLGLEENAFVLRRTRLFSTRGSDGQTRLWQLVFRYPASASGSNLQLRPTVNRASLPRLVVYGCPRGKPRNG